MRKVELSAITISLRKEFAAKVQTMILASCMKTAQKILNLRNELHLFLMRVSVELTNFLRFLKAYHILYGAGHCKFFYFLRL